MPLPGTRKSDRAVRNLDQFPFGLGLVADFSLTGILVSILLSVVISILLWIPLKIIAELVRASARRSVIEVNFEKGQVRRGRRAIPFSAIDRAFVDTRVAQVTGWLELRLRATGAFEFIVPIRTSASEVISPVTRQLLLRMLPETSIEMPVDPFDPKGKFATFPDSLTKEGAIELVTNPGAPVSGSAK